MKSYGKEYYYKLKSVANDRLSPDGISAFILASFIVSGILGLVVFYAVDYSRLVDNSIWPLYIKVNNVCLLIHFVCAVVYMKLPFAYKHQKLQAIILCVVSIKMSIDGYAVFLVACDDKGVASSIVYGGLILLIGGIILLVISVLRGLKRVGNGELKQEGKGLYNFKESKVYASTPLIFSLISMSGVISKVLSGSEDKGANSLGVVFILFLSFVIQYTIAIAWPEILLITICRFRFESFRDKMPERFKRVKE